MIKFDYIVVGGGLSGLYTAFLLSKKGKVALLAKTSLLESNSYQAQGGLAAVTDDEDTEHAHYLDTLEAGRGLCKNEAVDILTQEAPKRIEELISMGMKFDKEKGKLSLGLEGGHSHKRILHAGGDATGRLVTEFVTNLVLKEDNITIFEHHIAIELITSDRKCVGLWCYNEKEHKQTAMISSAVVLATGGAAALYNPTTNPLTSLGDGLILAHDAGAELMDLEFIQFHPTALYVPNESSFLISEAVRGEGAYLLDESGNRFMLGKHELAELAPRDVVAREIYNTMERDHSGRVTLSLKHLDCEHITSRFPTIAKYCKSKGMNLCDSIPVTPAAHYSVGGIKVNLNGKTCVDGLYAVGEVSATGVMGANRLASNSLTECLVFGKRIADDIHNKTVNEDVIISTNEPLRLYELSKENLLANEVESITQLLRVTMTKDVGIVRDKRKLLEAIDFIKKVISTVEPRKDIYVSQRLLYNRCRVALFIAKSALLRKESRGGHFRIDYPKTIEQEKAYHTVIRENNIYHNKI